MRSLDSHSNLIDDYYLSKIAWKLSYFSPSLKALFLHILALCKISDHAVTWFDDGADASPSQGNKDCPRVFFVFFGFMWEFASLTVAPSFSVAYCSGLNIWLFHNLQCLCVLHVLELSALFVNFMGCMSIY